MYNTNLNEILDLAPFNLELYGNIEGYDIYSNEKIENTIKYIAYKSKFKQVAKTIERGLERKKIIIGFSDTSKRILFKDLKSFISHIDIFNIFGIKNKITKGSDIQSEDVNTLGFYSSKLKTSVVLVDKKVNILGMRTKKIIPTIVHELVHGVAEENPSMFFNVLGSTYLIPFYKNLVIALDKNNENIKDQDLYNMVKKLVLLNEKDVTKTKNLMVKSFILWKKLFDTIHDEKTSLRYSKFLLLPYVGFISQQLNPIYMNSALDSAKVYLTAYYRTFGENVIEYTIPGQEFRLTSEIVAIISQIKLQNDVATLINKLDF